MAAFLTIALGGTALAAETAAMEAQLMKENVTVMKKPYSPNMSKDYPKNVYFGDTHLHTLNSPGAYPYSGKVGGRP
jgi:hypothetical protein